MPTIKRFILGTMLALSLAGAGSAVTTGALHAAASRPTMSVARPSAYVLPRSPLMFGSHQPLRRPLMFGSHRVCY